jgi:hypothetical protein
VLEQAQPGGLRDIGSVALGQLEFDSDGPDEPLVLGNEAIPRHHVPVGSTPHQLRDVAGVNALLHDHGHSPGSSLYEIVHDGRCTLS